MDLTILIVSYNTRDLTLECLRSVFAETRDLQFEVIVLDNASTDGSAKAIEQSFPRVRTLRNTENVGFASANNQASAFASGRRFLLLNPDTVVLDRAIEKLVAVADAHPDAGIWGGWTFYENGARNPNFCFGPPSVRGLACRAAGLSSAFPRSRLFNPTGIGFWTEDALRHADIVSGCFLLIDAGLWRRLGGFDSHYFMYGEDFDLCLRARKMGYRPLVTKDARIVHHGGRAEGVRAERLVRLYQAWSHVVSRHVSGVGAPVGRALVFLDVFLRATCYSAAAIVAHARFGPRAACWREVWRRRSAWAATSGCVVEGGREDPGT